jgi:hypothetical protein
MNANDEFINPAPGLEFARAAQLPYRSPYGK